MDPVEALDTQDYRGGGSTQRCQIPETSSQARFGTENTTAEKGLREAGTSDDERDERRNIEQLASESEVKEVEAALTDSSQAEHLSTPDSLAIWQCILEELMGFTILNAAEPANVGQSLNTTNKGMVSRSLNEDQILAHGLWDFGVSMYEDFNRTGNVDDINSTIECWGIAIALLQDSQTYRWLRLGHLGNAYNSRFRRLGDVCDLNNAIESTAESVSLVPDGHPNKPLCLSNLGNSYWIRSQCLGELSDLSKAIGLHTEAVLLTPDGHPGKPAYLNNLGVSYADRFQRLGELSDLSKAITSIAEAVLLTPEGHPDKSQYLNNLGNFYTTQFQRLGDLPGLGKAIECQEEAISLTPAGRPDRPAMLSNLGTSYMARFQHLGNLSDLSKAVESQGAAVSLIPDGHPDKLGVLTNLGNSYFTRFERLGELSDLSAAIELQARAIELTPGGRIYKPRVLINLANSYFARFVRVGELPNLNKAIELQAEAISLTLDSHPDKPAMLSNLGTSYHHRFKRQGELSDLNQAIEVQTEAVSLSPDAHPNMPGYFNNLGNSYMTRFQRLSELSDLSKAIELFAEAVSLTPDGNLDKSKRLNNIGLSYVTRFQRLGDPSDLKSAEKSFRIASNSPSGSPYDRFYACHQLARLSLSDSVSSPFLAFKQAMSLIPQLVWIGTTIGRRYELVTAVSSFATEAASYAISVGMLELALEWLEAGRSIVWGQIAQLRTPFEYLSAHNPRLAEELTSVGRQLEHAGSRSCPPLSLHANGPDLGQEANAHLQLALRWDGLLEEIRLMPGFEDFLRTPTAGQLLSTARTHPIVVIALYQSRCDALILQPDADTISHVALPNFSSEDAIFARNLVFSRVRDRKMGQPLIPPSTDHWQSSLEKLWSGMIKPVLDTLGYTCKLPVEQLPHITWCTTGALSFLPLHTARSRDDLQPSAFDLVISSYTPTLGALLASQSVNSSSTCGVLAVGQENTPGLGSLPCTTRELAVIHEQAESCCYLQLENDEATVEQVLDAMDQFSWVHMACHGSQDPYEPTRSAFHLHDGDLTLADITRRSFTNKGLAFLSACQTATGDENMPDEAVHLAAGMLMAGYPSVIGTMWSIADEDGPEVADLVYAELLKGEKMDHTNAARALHRAVAQLREKVGVERIERWAPFIHLGI